MGEAGAVAPESNHAPERASRAESIPGAHQCSGAEPPGSVRCVGNGGAQWSGMPE